MYDQGQVPASLNRRLQQTLQNNALAIEASQAIILAQVFAQTGSTVTMETLDRIIGAQIDIIPISQVFDAFIAFATA